MQESYEILKNSTRIMNIMKIIILRVQNHEIHEILRIRRQNYENHEHLIIPRQNHKQIIKFI